MPSQASSPHRARCWTLVLPLPGGRGDAIRAADGRGALASALASLRPAPLHPPQPSRDGADGELTLSSAWLARRLGMGAAVVPTAPYAWAALAEGTGDARASATWRAHCDIVRLTPARDGFALHPVDLDGFTPAVLEQMFAIASDRIARQGWALRAVGRHWFLESEQPWDYQATGIASLRLHPRSVALPQGRDARAWRLASDTISMDWHALALGPGDGDAHAAQGLFLGLWLHGGGHWQPSARNAPLRLQSRDPTLRGWHAAAAPGLREADATAGDLLECDLDEPMPDDDVAGSIARRVQSSLALARAQGFRELELVLCTDRSVRALRGRIDGPGWLRSLRARILPRIRPEEILPP